MAVTIVLAFMVTVQVGLFPTQAPDHSEKIELDEGAALRITSVPELKTVPEGFLTRHLPQIPFCLPSGYR